MTQKELKELIKSIVQEYTGTGSSGGNATDGNDIPSPRPFADDEDELENYTHKNVYGAEGGHYRKDRYTGNYPNRQKMGMFELRSLIKKMLEEIDEEAYNHATLTTQGQYKSRFTKTGRPPGIMDEQLTPGEMAQFNKKKIEYQKKIAGVDIEIAKKNREAISAQLQQQTQQLTPQLDQIEQQLYTINQTIADKKGQRGLIRRDLKQANIDFDEIDPVDEESRQKAMERIKELETNLSTVEGEIKTSTEQRQGITQQRDNILKQRSQAQAQASTSMKQADQAIRDQKKAMSNIGKQQMQEKLKHDYIKERINVNLMEQMDSYSKNIRGSLKKIFKMFEQGKTNEEVLRHYAEKGISIPETYITKAKKYFESYKKLQLELGFMEQEAKDFKKPSVMEDEPTENKQLASGLFKEYIKKELTKLKK